MLATPLTACPATRVKSGPPAATVATAPGSRCSALLTGAEGPDAFDGADAVEASGCFSTAAAPESAAVRMVTATPPTKPAMTKTLERMTRRNILRDVDAADASLVRLGNRDGEDAVLEIGGDALDLDRFGQRERALEAAVSALHAMELLARNIASRAGGARAANDDAAVFRVNLDLLARQAGELRCQDEGGRRFVEIDRRRPAGSVAAHELTNLLVQREQVAERIP